MVYYRAIQGIPVIQAFHSENNHLTYIMTMPNLDAMGYRWVNTLAGFDFKIEYLKGTNNKVAHVLSHVKIRLDDATTLEFLADYSNPILKGARGN